MFCFLCGTPLLVNTNFCPNCGASMQNQEFGQVQLAPQSATLNQGQTELPNKIVGHLHYELMKLSIEFAHEYVNNMTLEYKNLDNLILNAESDISEILSQVNCYFEMFLHENNVYQYQAEEIEAYTQQYTGSWLEVFNKAFATYQNITIEEQQMCQYRQARKAGRSRVIGGGFTFSGAVKGMAAAGAVNMTTGLLHSLANSWGNARDSAEAERKKMALFKDIVFRDDLETAILEDCYNMLEGFSILWNQLNIGHLTYYSIVNLEHAINIEQAILEGKVPKKQYETSLLKMLQIYPVDPCLYLFSATVLPEKRNDFFSMALDYGFDLYTQQRQLQLSAQKYAVELVDNHLFYELYYDISNSLAETINYIADIYADLMCKNFIIFSEAYQKQSAEQLRTARNVFAPYGNSENPILLLTSTVFGGGEKGILLTDKKLYIHGGGYQKSPHSYLLEEVESIELISIHECLHINVNGEDEVQTFSSLENDTIIDIIKFFILYCLFIHSNAGLSNNDFIQDICRYTGLSEKSLNEQYRCIDSKNRDKEPLLSVQYCFECGAENENTAQFCGECGSSLV